MDIRELAQRATDAWNARDEEGFQALYTDDCEATAPGFTGKGVQGLRDFWALWNNAFPDNAVTRRTLIAEGDTCAELAEFRGTHLGPLPAPDGTEVPPTGRQVAVSFTLISTARGGRIATNVFHFDQLDLLTQLGLMPG